MNCRSAVHDLGVPAGRDMLGHAAPTPGLETIRKVSGPAASIILGQAEIARKPSRPSSSQHLAG